MALKRQYPHVDQVKDPQIQQALHILFDLVYQTRDDAATDRATLVAQATSLTEMTATLDQTTKDAKAALVLAGKEATPVGTAVQQTGSGDQGDGSGGSPDPAAGSASSGCSNAGGNGHVPPGSAKNYNTLGMIVCGTGNEFPALKAVAVDLPTRTTNAVELLGRMIWHLQIAGYLAGRQRNPSGLISSDKLTAQINGVWRAFDVFIGWDDFTVPLVTVANEVFPANYVVDGGVPD